MPSSAQLRICVIGAGPSGCSALLHLTSSAGNSGSAGSLTSSGKLCSTGTEIPEVVCFEKQEDWGGMWNFDSRTDVDQFGEPIHGSMYRHLWVNGPKEAHELPDYTYEEHFGKAIPSFVPRAIVKDYLVGRWRQHHLKRFIRFSHSVKSVVYNAISDDFTVVAKDLNEDALLSPQRFSHVIVASGHYSKPNIPSFPGVETFPGRTLHSREMRSAEEFNGKRILVIGAGLSAEDVALQCVKFGASSVIISWRTRPMNLAWPAQIEERPLVTGIEGSEISFEDSSKALVDAVIYCTGYLHDYPFLPDEIRLETRNRCFPPDLYKGALFLGGGNRKLFYLGANTHQYYTFTMFDQQALWTANVIAGKIILPEIEVMKEDSEKWGKDEESCKDFLEEIDFLSSYQKDLSQENGCDRDLDTAFHMRQCSADRMDDSGPKLPGTDNLRSTSVTTYRDQPFTSIFTGTQAPKPKKPFMEVFEDSIESFLEREAGIVRGKDAKDS